MNKRSCNSKGHQGFTASEMVTVKRVYVRLNLIRESLSADKNINGNIRFLQSSLTGKNHFTSTLQISK